MEPQIRYAQTTDGVSIAFWVMGDGSPLVYLPPIWSHAQLDRHLPQTRELFDWLSSRHRLIRLDPRNTGMSQRSVADVSLEARERDLTAVADQLTLKEFSLFGHGLNANVAIAFAANNPDRVRRLIIDNGVLALRGDSITPGLRAIGLLLEQDWETFTETAAGMVFGWAPDDETRRYAALLRDSVTPEDMKRWAAGRYDISEFLPRITAPTLVLHQRGGLLTTIETGRRIAAQIPNARLVALEGRGMERWDPHLRSVVDDFMDEDDEARSSALPPQGTAIILFADIVDSTALTERMGDAAFRERARALDDALRTIIKSASGTAIDGKLLGDGVLATFPAASQAIDAALRCATAGDDGGLPLHLGLHAGDVIREQDNVFGGAVNIASRISGLSAPGEVLVSDVVRALARTSAAVTFEDRGEHALKGVGEPQRVYAVRVSA